MTLANINQTGPLYYIIQLQIIYLLRARYNVSVTCGPSAIAGPLVTFTYAARRHQTATATRA